MTWWWPNDGWMKKWMKLICPDANSGPSEQKLKFVNLGHVEEISFVTVPFCKRQICVFGFVCMSDAFFCETVWPFVCISSPLRTRWEKGWFLRPPQPARDSRTTPRPTQTPPIIHPVNREGLHVLKQPGRWPFKPNVSYLKAFWMKNCNVKMLQEPRTAPPGWVLTIYNSIRHPDVRL